MIRHRDALEEFARLYYNSRAYSKLSWHGYPMLKYPTDLFVYADLLWKIRPSLVIETGTFAGGSALYLAHQLDAIGGDGVVVTIDVDDWSGPDGYPDHLRIRYVQGSSTDSDVVDRVMGFYDGGSVLVVLDSCHAAEHVYQELQLYGELVTVGSYLVVEDTNVHAVRDDYGLGPDDALAKWLPRHPEFLVDRDCERFLLTAAPGGWLRRV